MAPITPYCAKCTGFGSILAPTSISTTAPAKVGTVTAMPGRTTFGMRRMCICAALTMAPVLPALTMACSRFSFFGLASFAITTMLASRLVRIASTGDSSMPMTSVVATIVSRLSEIPRSLNVSSMTRRSPYKTSSSSAASFGSAAIQPFRISSGALSPPMTSTPSRMNY